MATPRATPERTVTRVRDVIASTSTPTAPTPIAVAPSRLAPVSARSATIEIPPATGVATPPKYYPTGKGPGGPIVRPAPVATSTEAAVIAAASGGTVAPTYMTPASLPPPSWSAPAIPSPSPDLPSIPSAETALVTSAGEGTPASAAVAGKGRGGSLLVGAGAGFLVGGPAGAIVGAVVAGMMSRPATTPPVQGFDGFWSSLKKAVKKVGYALDVTDSSSLIRRTGRAADLTYSKGAIGQYTYKIARPAVATVAAGYTGGLSVLAGEKGWIPRSTFGVKSTLTGYKIGASVGGAILAGKGIASVAGAGASNIAPQATPTQDVIAATSMPEAPPVSVASTSDGAPKGGTGALLAGAGVGFVAGGPIGAVVGGVVGYALSKRKG